MADLIDRVELRKDFCNMCEAMQPEMIDCNKKGCMSMQIIDEQPAVNRWIPCSERLPENDAKCLVYFDRRVAMARWYGNYDEQGAWYIISDDVPKLYRIKNVPYWMPLPDLPKEDET